jgi:hypothetical protein
VASIHESDLRTRLEQRLRLLTPESKPHWGKMSVDQMLWHVNQAMATALGAHEAPAIRMPLPRAVMKFIVLTLPWTKNAPTAPSFKTQARHDFEAERSRCLQLIDQMAARPLDQAWGPHPLLGTLSGEETSRLVAKHLDHHLKQFGV